MDVTPYTGYEVDVYRCVYDANDNLISRTYENHSRYAKRDKKILYNPADEGPWGSAVDPGGQPSGLKRMPHMKSTVSWEKPSNIAQPPHGSWIGPYPPSGVPSGDGTGSTQPHEGAGRAGPGPAAGPLSQERAEPENLPHLPGRPAAVRPGAL